MKMKLLGVNIDHVATIRQARGDVFPDPIEAALACQKAGADSIVAHLREDRRHIQDADIARLKKKLSIPLNMEMSIHPSVLETAYRVRPHHVTFVPEKRQEKTTESGLDVAGLADRLRPILVQMQKHRIGVSLFIDTDARQIDAAKALGVEAIEIHTGAYATAKTPSKARAEAVRIAHAVKRSNALGLLTHVGHGLDYENTSRIAAIPGICEFNIGFSIVARSVFSGLPAAVREMKRLLRR